MKKNKILLSFLLVVILLVSVGIVLSGGEPPPGGGGGSGGGGGGGSGGGGGGGGHSCDYDYDGNATILTNEAVDTNENELYNYLGFEIQLNITRSGNYRIGEK